MNEIEHALGQLRFDTRGAQGWASRFAVSDLATQSMGAAGSAIADLIASLGLAPRPDVAIDSRLASLWFAHSIRPEGWDIPSLWDAIAGDYQTADGWIRLHTNAPHHRSAALQVLGCDGSRASVAKACARWDAGTLEAAVVAQGGVAAAMQSMEIWQAHPQGIAVAQEPLVGWSTRPGTIRDWKPTRSQPLAGLRVLDLTRVLAGPIATRLLAGFGAEVLRVDPPDWNEPGVIPDVTLGKRCCRLDLKTPQGLAQFETLLSRADVLVHGYRPGALDGLITPDRRRQIAPNLIEGMLCAYGWSGPMATRRGFDSLIQMSAGIAHAGMAWADAKTPHPLPVQALDHATGYFLAASVITALRKAVAGEGLSSARLSLARTADLLMRMAPTTPDPLPAATPGDYSEALEQTTWGPAHRLRPAIIIHGTPVRWALPASDLGSALPQWS